MTTLYQTYERDQTKETDGIKFEPVPGVKLWLARAGGSNAEFAEALDEATKPYRSMKGGLPADREREVLAGVYAKTIVKRWQGVTDRNGEALDFTEDNARQLLIDLPDLFDDIRQLASARDLYSMQVAEETAGNSPTG